MPLAIGQVLHNNRYRIDGLLGQGGMGAVYRAWDTSLDMPVAIKENLDASSAAQRQFTHEARILAHLSHPNLPRVTDHFFIPGQGQYLVMDFVEGEDLRAMLDRLGLLPEPHVLSWVSQICDALAYLHSQPSPIIHRDIKPANIKIRPDGRAMLVDFGIAKVYDPHLATTIGAKAVTPGYSPPEQYGGGSTDARSDIYALGATLYHLLTGQKPPESVYRMVSEAAMPSPRQLNQQISPMVEQVILKAIEVTTDRRFQSVDELRTALAQPLRDTVGREATPPVAPAWTKLVPEQKPAVTLPRAERPSRFSRVGLLGGIGLVLIALVVGALAISGLFSGPRPTPTLAVAVLTTDAPAQVAVEKTRTSTAPEPPTNTPVPESIPAVEPFECRDAIGCVDIPPDDPVRIGYALVIAGPNESLGVDSRRGVEIAIADHEKVLGHPIKLVGEDSMCSAEGGQTALTRLVSDPSLIGVIGPNCSSAGEPASRIASDAGIVLISPSNTAPSLTDPAFAWNVGYLRTCHNDKIQGAAMAHYVYDELGLRTAATIHDGSPYADQLQQVFAEMFESLGGTITAQEAVNVGGTDMRPVLTTIAVDSPEFLYYPIFIPEGAQITMQAGEVAGLENTTLAGADGMYSPDFIAAAGAACEGMYISGPNLAFENPIYEHFLEVHTEKYGEDPLSVFHAHAYDGTMMLLAAIEKVAVQDEDGTLHIGRQALRDALYGTKNFDGITGNLTCDQYGDCANPQIEVVQIQNGEYVPLWQYKP